MSTLNKKTISAKYIKQFQSIFKCPICAVNMKIIEEKSLVCDNNHSFDLAKQGYVNLLPRPLPSKYDKELFESRKLIANSGFFEPLSELIGNIITSEMPSSNQSLKILDTGCGEGSHLVSIKEKIQANSTFDVIGVGVDLAKEGILAAAKNYFNLIWCVADLANSPYQDGAFSVILNILSPSNYAEFKRLIGDSGIVIKVVPRSDYLLELREAFYEESEKQSYTNENIVERFGTNFESINVQRLSYKAPINQSLLPHLVRMTPLTWGTTEEKIHSLLQKNITEITVDLDILIGRKKA